MDYKDYIQFLTGCGVRFESRTGLPVACGVRLDRNGYCVVLGDAFEAFSDAAKLVALQHEMSHIVRGDLVGFDRFETAVANVAMDAVINHRLDVTPIVESGYQPVTYDRLREQDAEIPSYQTGWRPIYEHLLQRRNRSATGRQGQESGQESDQESDQESGQGSGQDFDFHEAADSATERLAAHAATIARMRGNIEKMQRSGDRSEREKAAEMDGEIRSAGGAVLTSDGGGVYRHKPVGDQRLRRLIAAVRGSVGEALQRERSYAREGRDEGLRGVVRRPKARIVIACDLSGSINHWEREFIASLTANLQRDYDVRCLAFAGRCVPWRPSAPHPVEVGNGTLFQPVYQAAKALKPDLLVFLTDGEAFDDKRNPFRFRAVEVIIKGKTLVEINKL